MIVPIRYIAAHRERNKSIEEEFSMMYYDALKSNEGVPVMKIYGALAIKHKRSRMTIRRIVRGYRNNAKSIN